MYDQLKHAPYKLIVTKIDGAIVETEWFSSASADRELLQARADASTKTAALYYGSPSQRAYVLLHPRTSVSEGT